MLNICCIKSPKRVLSKRVKSVFFILENIRNNIHNVVIFSGNNVLRLENGLIEEVGERYEQVLDWRRQIEVKSL